MSQMTECGRKDPETPSKERIGDEERDNCMPFLRTKTRLLQHLYNGGNRKKHLSKKKR